MMNQDEHNLTLVVSPQQVDEENASFYNRFPYPWQPATFDYPNDPGLYARLVNQNLGAYDRNVIPVDADIWVAGCGTNQGIYTGLRFPGATVVGSDLSANSLTLSAKIAGQIGLRNLELREESINQGRYSECFDYVICTGVIHHNADPALTLRKLAQSLRPSGVLELMVYNRYRRLLPQAFRKEHSPDVRQRTPKQPRRVGSGVCAKAHARFQNAQPDADFSGGPRQRPGAGPG